MGVLLINYRCIIGGYRKWLWGILYHLVLSALWEVTIGHRTYIRLQVTEFHIPNRDSSKMGLCPSRLASLDLTCLVRAVRDATVKGYNTPGINNTGPFAYCPLMAVSPFLLTLSDSYFEQTLWTCGILWPIVTMYQKKFRGYTYLAELQFDSSRCQNLSLHSF
jgi:hypothetical protein